MAESNQIPKEKIIKNIYPEHSFENGEPTDIREVIGWLQQVISEGATHITWSAEHDWDGDIESVEGLAVIISDETDDQYELRVARIKEKDNTSRMQIENQQRMEFERLKNIFEPKI